MAFGGEKLLKALRDPNVVLSPAEVEAAMALEDMLKPNPEHGRKRTYPTGRDQTQSEEQSERRGVRPARRIRVGRGG